MLAGVTAEMKRKNKIIAFVGMTGSGKTEAGKIAAELGLPVLRFGQAVVDEALQRGGVGEEFERGVRNELRKKYGMGALAVINLEQIDRSLKETDVIVSDLYSWDEYKVLRARFGKDRVVLVAICASPKVRYARLKNRHFDPAKDKQALYRSYNREDAETRDFAEIEESDKGGPIAMADYYILNESGIEDFRNKVLAIVRAETGIKT